MGRGPDCPLVLTHVDDVVDVAENGLDEETADDDEADDGMVRVQLLRQPTVSAVLMFERRGMGSIQARGAHSLGTLA